MKNQSSVQSPGSRASERRSAARPSTLDPRLSTVVIGFTLVEVLVTMVLLSLIVLALMTVFNSTQNAFRASLTQTDVLESGRLVMGLMTSDLETMTPSLGFGTTNNVSNTNGAVNFYANTNFGYPQILQALIASSQLRTNLLENFFVLGQQNVNGTPSWVGTGYVVVTNSSEGLYSLYRFSTNVPVMATDPAGLFYTSFYNFLSSPTNYSHLLDGVVDLTVRAYDPNGFGMTNNVDLYNGQLITNQNTAFYLQAAPGVVGFYMYSNTLPASVEVEVGVLEDAVLQRAEGFSGAAQMNYLSNHVGQVHLFRQRVLIRNVDPTAYQ